MASHEGWSVKIETTPARKRIIKEMRRRHFKKPETSDADIVQFITEVAFTMPERVTDAMDHLVHYRDAEDLSDTNAIHQVTGFVAGKIAKANK